MKPKSYPILTQAIEEGVLLGFNRAEKLGSITDDSNNLIARKELRDAIMLCICEYFSFEEDD